MVHIFKLELSAAVFCKQYLVLDFQLNALVITDRNYLACLRFFFGCFGQILPGSGLAFLLHGTDKDTCAQWLNIDLCHFIRAVIDP